MAQSFVNESIDLKAAVHSRAASRALSRLNFSNDHATVDHVVEQESAAIRPPVAHDGPKISRKPTSPAQSSTEDVSISRQHSKLVTTRPVLISYTGHDDDTRRSNDSGALGQLLLGSTAMAMGAVVQVFKGKGGKATLAAWNKVLLHSNDQIVCSLLLAYKRIARLKKSPATKDEGQRQAIRQSTWKCRPDRLHE